MTYFDIKYKWLDAKGATSSEIAATCARLQIFLGNNNITEHRPPPRTAALQLPVFYLAEWIAENWWVLLFEPRKHEEEEDPDYMSRHSILAAQNGFPLPALSIVPFGRSIGLSSVPRRAPFANVQFTVDAFGDAPRAEVETVLSRFIEDTVTRLESCGLSNMKLRETWHALQSLSDDERQFCELIGSLGLSPADARDQLLDAIERLCDIFGEGAVRDFCLASTESQVGGALALAEDVITSLGGTVTSQLAPLLSARLPAENYFAPSWRRGLQAARNARETLNISPKDPNGADKFLEIMRIDASTAIPVRVNNAAAIPLTGAIDRYDAEAKIVLLQDEEFQRRFSAIRAAYLAWVSEERSRRLVTNAVTRDQQASRQFSAEILIPRGQLEALAGPKRELRHDQIYEAARQRKAMPDVARWQARNTGLRIAAI